MKIGIILLLLLVAGKTCHAESACFKAAKEWISEVDNSKKDVLLIHTNSRCESSAQWILKSRLSERKRLCNDLVLLWTHKECVYFRDYVASETYSPCKAWSREMFNQCMKKNDAWFIFK